MKVNVNYKLIYHTDADLTFCGCDATITSKVVYVKLRDREFIFDIDLDRESIMAPYIHVKDLTVLSEEEFFQEMLTWDYDIPIELAREIQRVGIEKIIHEVDEKDIRQYFETETWEGTVEY